MAKWRLVYQCNQTISEIGANLLENISEYSDNSSFEEELNETPSPEVMISPALSKIIIHELKPNFYLAKTNHPML